jgi:hypothetical protein
VHNSNDVVFSKVGNAESVTNAVTSLLDEWSRLTHIYDLVLDWQDQQDEQFDLHDVRISKYDFRTVQLEYGPGMGMCDV